jgi:hypothetical protein
MVNSYRGFESRHSPGSWGMSVNRPTQVGVEQLDAHWSVKPAPTCSEGSTPSLGTMKDFQDFIDELIDEWHAGDSPLPLHEYLGMTWEEYKLWLSD